MLRFDVKALEYVERHVPTRLVQELDADQVVVILEAAGQVRDDPQRVI
jgi:hypothetical protein